MVQDHPMTLPPPIATKVLLTASTELGRSGQTLRPLFASSRRPACQLSSDPS